MSATETPDPSAKKKPTAPEGKAPSSGWPARIGWMAARLLVMGAGTLVAAHWLDRLWSNGWFQLTGALIVCLGLPYAFLVLIRRKAGRLGGRVRFRWLTLAALVNLLLLISIISGQPTAFTDALKDEGLGSLKWVARHMGATVPGGGTDEAQDAEVDGTADTDAEVAATEIPEDGPPPEPPTEAATEDVAVAIGLTSGSPIPFDNESGQMVIQARVGGGELLPFVLDTGATYSTLSAAALAGLGQTIPDDAPSKTMRTAGGEADGPVVLLDSVEVGGQRRDGVAFWICEPCASGDAVGLLGLNVWQGYLLTIDPADQNVWLQPKEASTNRLYDVESFLTITSPTSRIEGDTVYVDLLLSNSSRRDVDQAVVLVTARDEAGRDVGAITVDAGGVPGLGSSMATGTMPDAGQTSQLTFSLIDARW